MATVTTGRTLGERGDPVPGTGFTVDTDSDLAARLARRTGPLNSHPTRAVWSAPLPTPDGDGDVDRAISILGPGYDGPPEHYHETTTERFELLAGEVVFEVDGTTRRAGPGDTVVVEPGRRHSFRAVGDGLSYMLTDIVEPGRLRHVLPTLGGIAHDPELDVDDPLQRVAIAHRLDGNTTFTDIDPRVARPLTQALAPLARALGYRGAYAKYTQPAFWKRHVEQPDLA